MEGSFLDAHMLRQQLTTLTHEAFCEKFQILFGSPQTAWRILYPTLDLRHAFFIEREQTLCGMLGYCDHWGSYYHFSPQLLRALLPGPQLSQTLDRLRYLQSDVVPDTLYIEALAVAPDFRRQGIAEKLLTHCRHYASAHGYHYLALDVASDNVPARTLYEKQGFIYQEYRQVPYELFGFKRFDHLICPL